VSKYTPDDHPDAPNVKQALDQIAVILDDLNNSKKTSDSQEKLKAIESSIAGMEEFPFEVSPAVTTKLLAAHILTNRTLKESCASEEELSL